MAGFSDESGEFTEFHWRNDDLAPDARPKGVDSPRERRRQRACSRFVPGCQPATVGQSPSSTRRLAARLGGPTARLRVAADRLDATWFEQ
jgi:hypothetical protein